MNFSKRLAVLVLAMHALAFDVGAQQGEETVIRPAAQPDLTRIRMHFGRTLRESEAILFRDVSIRITRGKKRDDHWNVCGYLNAKGDDDAYIGFRGFYLSGLYDRVARNLVLINGPKIHDPDSGSSFSIPIEFCKRFGMPLKSKN